MRYITAIVTLVIVGIVFAAPPKVVDTLTGKVIGVTDGDTIKVLVNRQTVKVRLEGVDAPESSQSFGTKSKQALAKMVFGKTVTIKKTGEDQEDRGGPIWSHSRDHYGGRHRRQCENDRRRLGVALQEI